MQPASAPSAQIVGQEFVKQYYTMLNAAPEHLHRYILGMLIYEQFFARVKNFNSWELDRVSMGILALRIWIPRKNYGGRCVELVSAYGLGDEK